MAKDKYKTKKCPHGEYTPTFYQSELDKMYEDYKYNIVKYYEQNYHECSVRARAALLSMIPLVRIIRKEIADEKIKRYEADLKNIDQTQNTDQSQ